jgi:hypothetical protein
MADGFAVDLAALTEAANGVNGVLEEVGQLPVTDIPHDEAHFGHHDLANALGDFLSRWKRGVSNLCSDGKQVADRLTANVNAYQKAENDAQQHLIKAGNELSGSGADPGEH